MTTFKNFRNRGDSDRNDHGDRGDDPQPVHLLVGAVAGFFASGLVHYNLGDTEVAMVLYTLMGLSMRLAIAGTGKGFADRIVIRAEDLVRGVATSGWRGRSWLAK